MCPKRIGHRYLHCDVSQLNWLKNLTVREDPRAHCVEENVRLLRYLDPAFAGTFTADTIPAMRLCLTEEERARGKVFRQSLGAATAVGIHAGTSVFKGHARRRWPKEKFVRLVDSLPGVAFVLFGTAEEAVANEYIVSHAAYPAKVTLVNSAPVREVAAMIGELDAFVTNDSGLMHIAAAMETPIVALLGPTNPAYIRPWKAACEVLRTGIACSPCFYYSPRPLRCSLNGTFQCMADLGVEAAHDALQRLCSVSPRRSVP
jgi:heptosyltransferase-2